MFESVLPISYTFCTALGSIALVLPLESVMFNFTVPSVATVTPDTNPLITALLPLVAAGLTASTILPINDCALLKSP